MFNVFGIPTYCASLPKDPCMISVKIIFANVFVQNRSQSNLSKLLSESLQSVYAWRDVTEKKTEVLNKAQWASLFFLNNRKQSITWCNREKRKPIHINCISEVSFPQGLKWSCHTYRILSRKPIKEQCHTRWPTDEFFRICQLCQQLLVKVRIHDCFAF